MVFGEGGVIYKIEINNQKYMSNWKRPVDDSLRSERHGGELLLGHYEAHTTINKKIWMNNILI